MGLARGHRTEILKVTYSLEPFQLNSPLTKMLEHVLYIMPWRRDLINFQLVQQEELMKEDDLKLGYGCELPLGWDKSSRSGLEVSR